MIRLCRRAALACVVVLLPSVALAQGLTDADGPNWQEDEIEFPPLPQEENLYEFFVTAASPNTFLIDESSIAVGEDRVVRYVLMVRTPGGAENITYEGIRCTTGEVRIYAHGRSDEWRPARRGGWKRLQPSGYNMPRAVLAIQHFCDGPAPPRSRQHALQGLYYGTGMPTEND